jgi:hypothetical protein
MRLANNFADARVASTRMQMTATTQDMKGKMGHESINSLYLEFVLPARVDKLLAMLATH